MFDHDVTNKLVLKPGPGHPITVEPAQSRIVVRAGDQVIADSRSALALREADHPVAFYVPRADVDMAALERSEAESYCPFKGDASYFSIPALGETGIDAVWTYETPYDAVTPIKEHLAFYPNRVQIEELPL